MKNQIVIALALIILGTGCQKEVVENITSAAGNSTTGTYIDTNLYTVTGNGLTSSGVILGDFNTSAGGYIVILDSAGKIIKEKKFGNKAYNFQKWNINGQTRYTYLETNGAYYITGITSTYIGYYHILDSNLNEINQVKLLSYGTVNSGIQDKLDTHDFILLGDNHYIAQAYYPIQASNIPDSLHPASGITVINNVIQEVKDGQVIWQWESMNTPEMYATSVENNDFSNAATTLDYAHLNSMTIDPSDSNLICSFRNLNQVLKINRSTGAIMWRLGGANSDFALTNDQKFLRQHYVRLVDNNQTLMLLDNGEATERPYSRVLEFKLNESAKTITSFKSYTIPDDFITYAGDVSKSDSTYFIGGGSSSYALEVNFVTNEVLLRLNQKVSSYRMIKYY